MCSQFNALEIDGSLFQQARSLAAGRTFDRRELRAIDSGKLGITSDDTPIVSQLASLSSVIA